MAATADAVDWTERGGATALVPSTPDRSPTHTTVAVISAQPVFVIARPSLLQAVAVNVHSR